MAERYLADENFPAAIVRYLRSQGDDVFFVAESMASASDEVILSAAVADDRVVLTFDSDFGELVVRRCSLISPQTAVARCAIAFPDCLLQLAADFARFLHRGYPEPVPPAPTSLIGPVARFACYIDRWSHVFFPCTLEAPINIWAVGRATAAVASQEIQG